MLLLLDFYAFYGFCVCLACVGSYLIDSSIRCVDWLAGGCPAAIYLFFASPKKSRQKKGDPAVLVPALRFGQHRPSQHRPSQNRTCRSEFGIASETCA